MLSLPRGPRKNDHYDIRIEHIAPGGIGVGYLHAQIGPQQQERTYPVHVRKAVPGDLVRVLVEQYRKGVMTGRIDELLEPAQSRQDARCDYFGLREVEGKGCGGCTLQSLGYEAQKQAKWHMVRRLMDKNHLKHVELQPVIGMETPWYYRNKMEFSFGDYDKQDFCVGLHPTGFKHDVIDVKHCWMLSEAAMDVVDAVRKWAIEHQLNPYKPRQNEGILRTLTIREGKRTGQRLVAVTTTPEMTFNEQTHHAINQLPTYLEGLPVDAVFWIEHRAIRGQPTTFVDHHLAGQPHLVEELHLPNERRLSFEVHPRAFFQPNTYQAEVLYGKVLELSGLLDNSMGYGLDLYCGTGTIGLCMAAYTSRVAGIELNPQAVKNARENASLNKIEHIHFAQGDVGKVLASGDVDINGVDVVVVDPPRAGLFPQAIDQLKLIRAPRLVYVSCNPESLVRDAQRLISEGYKLVHAQPVDMFPHTHHIENIAVFELS